MSRRGSSRTTRRILQIASLGLAGLIAGLLSGCSASGIRDFVKPNDTDWQTSSTYASATTELPPREAVRSPHLHLCSGGPCPVRIETERLHGPHGSL